MTSTNRLVLTALLVLAPAHASAQATPAQRARQLLERAEQAYVRMRMDEAERNVIEAVGICEREGCPAANRAHLYVVLGTIVFVASSDGLRARMALDRALRLDPDIALDRNMATPEVRALYDAIRASLFGAAAAPPFESTGPAAIAPAGPAGSGAAPPSAGERASEGEACTDDAACGDGLACEANECVAEGAVAPAAHDTPPLAPLGGRRAVFFMELGYTATAASAHRDMQVATRPDAVFFGEDFQLDGRRDNDSYILEGTYGCAAPTNEYCVRVTDGRFAFAYGIHAAIGAYLTEHFGLAARVRLAPIAGGGSLFGARGTGGGTLSHVVLGPRIYVRPITPLPEGFHLAVFVGGMVGQIQVHPRQEETVQGAAIARPWGRTGLYGAELGVPFGVRVSKGFGLFLSPEAYVLAPAFSFGLQVTGGIDVGFGTASAD